MTIIERGAGKKGGGKNTKNKIERNKVSDKVKARERGKNEKLKDKNMTKMKTRGKWKRQGEKEMYDIMTLMETRVGGKKRKMSKKLKSQGRKGGKQTKRQTRTRENFVICGSPQSVVERGGHDLAVVLVECKGRDPLRVCLLHLAQTLTCVDPPHLMREKPVTLYLGWLWWNE